MAQERSTTESQESRSEPDFWELRLYVAGQTPKSVRLLYIPATEEKKVGFSIENIEVP